MVSAIILALCVSGTMIELGLNLLKSINSLDGEYDDFSSKKEKKEDTIHVNGASESSEKYGTLLFRQTTDIKSKLRVTRSSIENYEEFDGKLRR